MHNSPIRHSGLDPESMKYLIILDSCFRRNDKTAGFMQLCKGLARLIQSANRPISTETLDEEKKKEKRPKVNYIKMVLSSSSAVLWIRTGQSEITNLTLLY